MYKKLFKEQDEEVVKLNDIEIVDKLVQWFMENPYPQDHSGLHKFAESLGLDADILETYIYAFVSCFLSGGNYNKSRKNYKDFDLEEIKMSKIVENEHIDVDNDNSVIKHIADIIRTRIGFDHIADNPSYYHDAKEGKLQIEELL